MNKATKKKILESLLVIIILVIGYLAKDKLGLDGEDAGTSSDIVTTAPTEITDQTADSLTETSEPTVTQTSTATPEPAATQAPIATVEPTATQTPTATLAPTATQAPTATPEPVADVVEIKYYFRNDTYMTQHFEKHGGEFEYETVEEYLEGANRVVQSKDALHKLEAEDGDDIYYLEDSNEFVVVSKDGYLRTYFKPSAGKKYYDRQ